MLIYLQKRYTYSPYQKDGEQKYWIPLSDQHVSCIFKEIPILTQKCLHFLNKTWRSEPYWALFSSSCSCFWHKKQPHGRTGCQRSSNSFDLKNSPTDGWGANENVIVIFIESQQFCDKLEILWYIISTFLITWRKNFL